MRAWRAWRAWFGQDAPFDVFEVESCFGDGGEAAGDVEFVFVESEGEDAVCRRGGVRVFGGQEGEGGAVETHEGPE